MSTSVQSYSSLFSQEVLDFLRAHSEVIRAKADIEDIPSGSVYFTLPLTDFIREPLEAVIGLDLSHLSSIPMRWIKGDLPPHADTGVDEFQKTHLIYLTSNDGYLRIDGTDYPIKEGTAYVFSEGSSHTTIGTGSEPRLIMGPMSEHGQAVGIFAITGVGGTTLYLRQNGSEVEYSFDDSSWNTVFWPCAIQNADTTNGYLEVQFTNDLTLSTTSWQYFVPMSTHIQFGSRLLKGNGTRPIITIDGISGYNGLIQNGTEYGNGNNNISVYNLEVRAVNESTLFTDPSGKGAGWVCQTYFGKGAQNNYVINCSSDAPIAEYGGAIIGSHAGSESGSVLYISGCSSSGTIGNSGGGILGASVGYNYGEIHCSGCWSTGEMGHFSGGIVGMNAAESYGSLEITRCYSTGFIGEDGGGIVGHFPGMLGGVVLISVCYSTGGIQLNGGGITGSMTTRTTITNCYSLGNIQSNAGGIVGLLPDVETTTITNCYTTGTTAGTLGYIIGGAIDIPSNCYAEAYDYSSGWNSTHANQVLTGLPTPVVGTSWVNTTTGQPYEIHMGYTPYSREIITVSPALRSVYEQTVAPGGVSAAAIVSGKSYTILQITNGSPSSYETISIDSTTGVVSTTSSIQIGVYTIYVRNTGSYHITQVTLTVSSPSCCDRPIKWSSLADDRTRMDTLAGNIMIGTFSHRRGPISYSDLMKMKMAYAAKI